MRLMVVAWLVVLSGCSLAVIGNTPDTIETSADCYPHRWPVAWDTLSGIGGLVVSGVALNSVSSEVSTEEAKAAREETRAIVLVTAAVSVAYLASALHGHGEAGKCQRLLREDARVEVEPEPEPAEEPEEPAAPEPPAESDVTAPGQAQDSEDPPPPPE